MVHLVLLCFCFSFCSPSATLDLIGACGDVAHPGLLQSAFRFSLNSQLSTSRLLPPYCSSLRFKRGHVDREAVLHVGLEQSFVSFVDLLDGNDFDVGSNVVGAAKIEHLLRFGDAANHRAGETTPPANEAERSDLQRLRGSADERKVTVDAE